MFARMSKRLVLLFVAVLLAGCQIQDDLLPSSDDKRSTVTAGTTGNNPDQTAADFTALDSLGGSFVLSDHLSGGVAADDVIVIYFTMWCPICLSHTDHLIYSLIPQFQSRGNVHYILVDYVSGSVVTTRAQEVANGYSGVFTVLADVDLSLTNQFDATMGSTIVIDSSGTIQMNEDYKDGSKLASVLDSILP